MTSEKRRMPFRGYASEFVDRVFLADATHPGVRLGRACITHKIPVADVAAAFGVSKLTIYTWFTGRFYPRKQSHLSQISEWVARYPC